MDSAFIHQAANELVQNAGTRNIKQIARSCSLDISETSRIKDMLGLLSLYFDKPLIVTTLFKATYGEFKTVRDDLHRLWKVKSCVDTAARFNERTEEQMHQNRPQTRQKKEELSR